MRIIKSILYFCFGFGGTIILFELLVSQGGILTSIVDIDAEKGERYRPNEICSSIFVSEGFGLAKTNSAGWFGREYKKKEPNDISIAVVGNSFVASRQVFYRDNFLSLAENELNAQLPQHHVYFYNFGKEDLPFKQLLYIKEEITSLCNPNYIIILINNESFNYGSKRYVPYYDLVGGELKLDTSFKDAPFVKIFQKYKLLTKSSLAFLGIRVKNRLPQTKEILFDKFVAPAKNINERDNHSSAVINPVDIAVIERLDQDRRVIFALDLNTAMTAEVKMIIKRAQIIELRQPLLKFKQKSGIDPYYWKLNEQSGHWNHAGHKIVGKEIANGILNNLATYNKAPHY